MTSNAQIQANRQNAAKSTGPKTVQGKTIASKNSVKHGLLTKDLLIRDEKETDLQDFGERIYETLCPRGAIEELLAEKIINISWRLQRCTQAEKEALDDEECIWNQGNLQQCFMGNGGISMANICRYEASLERCFYKALHELQRLQAMRLGLAVMAPIVVEVGSSTTGNL